MGLPGRHARLARRCRPRGHPTGRVVARNGARPVLAFLGGPVPGTLRINDLRETARINDLRDRGIAEFLGHRGVVEFLGYSGIFGV